MDWSTSVDSSKIAWIKLQLRKGQDKLHAQIDWAIQTVRAKK